MSADEIPEPKKVIIDRVEIVYHSSSYDDMQTHIQPVYKLHGIIEDDAGESYDFNTKLSALPDDEVYDPY